MKGLSVDIIGRDCTNYGVTSGKSRATLILDDAPIFEATQETPALGLIEDDGPSGYLMVHSSGKVRRVKAAPIIDGKPKPGMFGGHFIFTSDSRFPYDCPIPVFDRFETAEEQRLYSA